MRDVSDIFALGLHMLREAREEGLYSDDAVEHGVHRAVQVVVGQTHGYVGLGVCSRWRGV